jgi:hypothetical protein
MNSEISIILGVSGSFRTKFTIAPMIQDEKSGVLIPIHNSNILLPSGENVYTEYQRFSSQAYEYTRQVKKIIDDAREAYRIQHIQGQIENIKGQIDNINTNDLRSSEESLIQNFRTWTNNANFEAAIDGIINSTVNNTGKDKVQRTTIRIHFTFSENNNDSDIFRRLPWYEITKIDDVAKKFVLLFPRTNYTRPMYNKESNLIFQLRVLVIRGCEDKYLKKNQDKEIKELKETPGVKVIEKKINNSEDLHNILTTENYNILVYNGHSNSENGGQILIGTGTVKIQDFEQDFRQAVRRGLKIAFFNSCDGLGIADFLTAKVGVPAVIVMKEPVPDHFANRFFISFIKDFFKDGNSLSIALENSRKSNEYIKAQFPGSSSLPVLIYSSVLTKDFRVSKLFIFLSNVSNTLKAMKNFLYKRNIDPAQQGDDLPKFSRIFQWFRILIHPAKMQRQRKISFIFVVFLIGLILAVLSSKDTFKVYTRTEPHTNNIKASSDSKYIVEGRNNNSIHVFNKDGFFAQKQKSICTIDEIKNFTFMNDSTLIITKATNDIDKDTLVKVDLDPCDQKYIGPKAQDLVLQDFSPQNNLALLLKRENDNDLYNFSTPTFPNIDNIPFPNTEGTDVIKDAKFWGKEKIIFVSQVVNHPDGTIKICNISSRKCESKITIITINDFDKESAPEIILSPNLKYLALKYISNSSEKSTTIRVWKIHNNNQFHEITDNPELKKLKHGIKSATFLQGGKDTELIVIKDY